MKLSYRLLELSHAGADFASASAVASAHGLPPYSPAGHPERLSDLKTILSNLNVPAITLAEAVALSAADRDAMVVFVAGSPSAYALYDTAHGLRNAGVHPILVIDALDNYPSLITTLQKLAEERFQYGVIGQVAGLVKCAMPMIYQYAKTDSTMTLMVVLDAGSPQASALTIERLRAPFKDEESFPGGFLDAHLESLTQCVAREAIEETHVTVAPSDVVLVDVRSSPDRDVRGHVNDHGYMWLVPACLKAAVLASVQAGDDAKPGSARFVPVVELVKKGHMAFDHYDLLLAAIATGRILPAANPFLRLLNKCINRLSRLAHRLAVNDRLLGQAYRRK
jgi:ADP-ribose pyrophosphatase YjhB (NUDIX family)